MVYNNGSAVQIQQHRLVLTKAFAEGNSCLFPNRVARVLDDYLDYLELELSNHHSVIKISQVQEMLLEISCIIRSGKTTVDAAVYARILKRLTRMYAQGLSQRKKDAFSLTAGDYAEVIEVISAEFPSYDYREVVGQLLNYMNHLYRLKKTGWITVYEHIRSMPNSIEALQDLKEARFLEIQKWVEEGVHNLFQIQSDLQKRVGQLEDEAAELQNVVEHEQYQLTFEFKRGEVPTDSKIASLYRERKRREITALREKRDRIISAKRGEEQIIQLIESNIQEFESKLKEARRNYLVRLVYSSSGG